MLRHRRWLLPLVAASAALAGMLVALATSSADTGRQRVERAVVEKVRGHGSIVRAACRSRHDGRWTCRWRTLRPRSERRARRCTGTARAVVAHRRVRVRLSRTRCRMVAYDAASAPGAIVGFNDNAVRAGQISPDRDAALTAAVGARLQRVTFDWRVVEPRAGEYHFEQYDEIYRALRARRIRPIFIPMFAPRWAVSQQGRSCFFFGRDCRFPPTPRMDGAWRDILTRLTRRYPAAAGIEIWNEPNLRVFWQPRPDPARYVQLLRSAWLAIKAADPGMAVITGGLSNLQQSGNGDISLPDFLSAMYSGGAQRWMDAIGVHPYPYSLSPTLFETSMNEVRAVRNAHGDVNRPIWVTELGLTTTGSSSQGAMTEQDQAAGVVKYLRLLEAMPDVKAIIFHTLVEPRGWLGSSEPGYGIVRRDLRPKPAYCALARALQASPSSC